VAIFDSADDVVEMLTRLLEEHGFQTVIGRMEEIQSGVLDLIAFLDEHDPQVIPFDLPRPYERPQLPPSPDDGRLAQGAGLRPDDDPRGGAEVAFRSVDGQPSIIGKPYVPTAVLQAVQTASEGRALGSDP
jgi:hypothetical protein